MKLSFENHIEESYVSAVLLSVLQHQESPLHFYRALHPSPDHDHSAEDALQLSKRPKVDQSSATSTQQPLAHLAAYTAHLLALPLAKEPQKPEKTNKRDYKKLLQLLGNFVSLC
jgi:hypothetical protein